MKRILFRVFFIIFLAFVLPVAAAHYKNMAETTEKIHIVNNVENNLDVQNSDTKNAKNDEPPASPAKNDGTPSRTITVLIHGDVHEMTLEDYTAGALAAEMPASFEEEALKAQAVAARTYALNKGPTDNHPDADLCTDYACCQAWISRADAQANWGDSAIEYTNKITAAVAETGNQVILYDGQLIDAVFHSSSASATQDAVEVWGNAVPYLTSVDSPEGDEVPNYHSTVTVPLDEFKSKLLAQYPQADLSGEPAGWFANLVPNSAGGVETVDIGGTTVGGGSLRTLFGLRSTSFTVSASADGVTFSVTGYGHGVGMSQYGANALAKEGKSYDEILKWYYTGIDVAPYTPQR